MEGNIDLYLFHSEETVVFSFFRDDKLLRSASVLKRELGEKMVEVFVSTLKSMNASLQDISSIYLNSSFSTWNASRLVTLFSKIFASFKPINFFSLKESYDKYDVDLALREFPKSKDKFRLISDINEFEPLYKKCPNIDI